MKKSIFVGLLIVTCAITGCSKVTPISKEITMELGRTLSDDPAQFVNVSDEDMLSEISMDFSEIDFDKVGEYTANAVYGEKEYPITIHIVDTVAPDVKVNTSYVITKPNEEVSIEDLLIEVSDKAETTAGFVSYERIGDIQAVSDNELLELAAPSANILERTEEVKLSKTVKFEAEGVYNVKIAVQDEAKNTVAFDVPFYIDGTAPVISNFEDQEIVYTSLPTGALYDVTKVTAVDNFDGDITESANTYLKEKIIENADNKMTVKVYLYATDRAGNTAEETFDVKISLDIETILAQGNYLTEEKAEEILKSMEASDSKNEVTEPYFDRNMAEQAFAAVNEQRTANGLQALVWDESLYEFACMRATQIVTDFSHNLPDGSSVPEYLVYQIGGSNGYGENIAKNYKSVSNLVNAWMNSPGHRANILNSIYNYGVMGCYYENGGYYWVNLFEI